MADEKKAPRNPYIVTDVVAHVVSNPVKRFPGWAPREDEFVEDPNDPDYKWLQKTYRDLGFSASAVIKFVRGVPDPDQYRPPLAYRRAIMEARVPEAKQGTPTVAILVASNALLHTSFAIFNGCIFVMASQGNILEARNMTEQTTPSGYAGDFTQGPIVSRTTIDGTLARFGNSRDCDVMGIWLEKHDPEYKNFFYKNGYLLPKPGKVKDCIQLLKDHGDDLLINIQQTRVDHAGEADDQHITTIPCFTVALGDNDIFKKDRTPEDEKLIPELCQTLLELQLIPIARLAVLKSQQLGRRIPLVLTPVGGGAFGNPLDSIRKAIESIRPIIAHADVDVVLSVFKESELSDYQKIPFLQGCQVITHDAMRDKKPKEPIGSPLPVEKDSKVKLSTPSLPDNKTGLQESTSNVSTSTKQPPPLKDIETTPLPPSYGMCSSAMRFFKANPTWSAVALAPIPTSIVLTYVVSLINDARFHTSSTKDSVDNFFRSGFDGAMSPGVIYGSAFVLTLIIFALMYKWDKKVEAWRQPEATHRRKPIPLSNSNTPTVSTNVG